MTKQLKLLQKVRVNEKAMRYMPHDIYLEGTVTEIENPTPKYHVSLRDGTSGWFEEEELDIIHENIHGAHITHDEEILHNAERALVRMIDWGYEQAEIQYRSDGALKVVSFNELKPYRGEIK